MLKTGVISALRAEAACLTGKAFTAGSPLGIQDPLLLVLSGMGKERVAAAIDALLAENAAALVSFGTAAAIAPGLKPGDLVIPGKIQLAGGQTVDINCPWRDRVLSHLQECPLTVQQGTLLHVDKPVNETTDKQRLHQQSGAIALDMESGLVVTAAQEKKRATLVLRVIIDDVDTRLPPAVITSTDEFGDIMIKPLLWNILKNPFLLPALISLGRHFSKAKTTMTWLGQNYKLWFYRQTDG